MAIRFYCLNCGQKIKAQDDMPGMKIACPVCREPQEVPHPSAAQQPQKAKQPELQLAARFDQADFETHPKDHHHVHREKDEETSAPINRVQKKRLFRGSLYFLFILAFIPLALVMMQDEPDDPIKQLQWSIDHELQGANQEKARRAFQRAKEGRASLDDVLRYFPNKKIKSAWLSRESDLHYYLALVCSVGYLVVVCICLPRGFTRVPLMVMIGGFTGVFGIGMLLILQMLAVSGWGVLVGGPFAIIIFMIGIAYRSLMNPDLPFFHCLVSFTFGVGLCEEIIKALPIFIIFLGRSRMRWHECCAFGLASGIGFGIAEGIHYSGNMYNGLCDQSIYLVRFISCVMLHAVWSAAAALFLHRYQKLTHGGMTFFQGFYRLCILISIPMVLHGLYDTFLTKNMDGLALAVALFSFGWLVLMVESARDREGDVLVQVPNVSHEGTPLHQQSRHDSEPPPFEEERHAVSPSPV